MGLMSGSLKVIVEASNLIVQSEVVKLIYPNQLLIMVKRKSQVNVNLIKKKLKKKVLKYKLDKKVATVSVTVLQVVRVSYGMKRKMARAG